jgi:hypothetical protein
MGTRNVSVVRLTYKPMSTVKQVGLAGDSIGGIYHHSNDDIAVRYTSFTLSFFLKFRKHTLVMLFRTALLIAASKAVPAWSHSLLYSIKIGGIEYPGWSHGDIHSKSLITSNVICLPSLIKHSAYSYAIALPDPSSQRALDCIQYVLILYVR